MVLSSLVEQLYPNYWTQLLGSWRHVGTHSDTNLPWPVMVSKVFVGWTQNVPTISKFNLSFFGSIFLHLSYSTTIWYGAINDFLLPQVNRTSSASARWRPRTLPHLLTGSFERTPEERQFALRSAEAAAKSDLKPNIVIIVMLYMSFWLSKMIDFTLIYWLMYKLLSYDTLNKIK